MKTMQRFEAAVSPRPDIKVLALGDPRSLAYQSIMETVRLLGALHFRSEHSFPSARAVVDFFFENGFDFILMPNPYGNKRRLFVYKEAKRFKAPLIAFDRGALPDSWFFDTGFNADSETYSPRLWDRPLTTDERDRVRAYIADVRRHASPLEAQRPRDGDETALRRRLGIGDKKFVFVPFQRPNDTTIKHFSGHVRDAEHFARMVGEISRLLTADADGWVVVGKKHPLEVQPPSCDIIFADQDENIGDLLEACSAVVCVNSGVGLLASLYLKPVFHFGSAFYAHPKLNISTPTPHHVIHILRNDGFVVDEETRDRLIHYLRTRVYSFGKIESFLKVEKNKSLRRVTTHIDFSAVNFPDMQKKKRCLYVTPVIPDRQNRGSVLRTRQTLRSIAASGYAIDLVILNRSERGVSSSALAERVSADFDFVDWTTVRRHPALLNPVERRKSIIWWEYLFFLTFDYLFLKNFCLRNTSEAPPRFERLVRRLVRKGRYDAVFFNYGKVVPRGLSPTFMRRSGPRLIVDTHDVQVNRMKNDVFSNMNRHLARARAWWFWRSERRALRCMDAILAISSVEADWLRRNDLSIAERVRLAPMALELQPIEPSTADRNDCSQYDFLFVGSNSEANASSLVWFLEKVWPKLVAIRPATSLHIVGRVGVNRSIARCLADAPSRTRIAQTTFVAEIEEAYRSSNVVIAPIVQGTGMKVKVIEAMSYGRPVLGTAVAFEGIDPGAPEAIVGADPDAFAAACLKIADDSARRLDIAALQARSFAHAHTAEASHRIFGELLGFGQ